jgi:hypothetical protein
LIKFNAIKLIEKTSAESSYESSTFEARTQDNEIIEAQRRNKKKSKKRVHHFNRNSLENDEEDFDFEQLEIDVQEPQKFGVSTDELILQSLEQALAVPVTLNDVCWICQLSWKEFVDLRLVTVLPCSHSACSSCLLKLLKSSNEKQKDGMGEFTYRFDCGICRLELDETIPHEAADKVLNKNLVPSFCQFISTGPSKDERTKRRQLVYSLLVDQFEYDVARVEATLFNLIEIMGVNGSEQLTPGLHFIYLFY